MNNLVCQRCTLGVVTIFFLFSAFFASADSEINVFGCIWDGCSGLKVIGAHGSG